MRYLPYKFTAKEMDEETGLYYYGARYLDAKYSRWLSADPAVSDYVSGISAGEGGIYNTVNFSLYHYAGNNPIRYTDPTGAFDWDTNTIESGDTLAKITNEYNEKNGTNYSYDDVAKANGIDDPNKIYAGSQLSFDGLKTNNAKKSFYEKIYGDHRLNGSVLENDGARSFYGSIGPDFRPDTSNVNISIEGGIAEWQGAIDFFANKKFNLGLSGYVGGFRGEAFAGMKEGKIGFGADVSVFKGGLSINPTLFGWKIKVGGSVMVGGIGGEILVSKRRFKAAVDYGYGIGVDVSWEKMR